MGLPEPAPVFDLPRRRSRLRAALVSLRPRQWTKNLLLFAGIIFAAKLGDLSRWGEAVAAFAAYCAASSAAASTSASRGESSPRAIGRARLTGCARSCGASRTSLTR